MDFDFNKFECLARHVSYLELSNPTFKERGHFLTGAFWAFEHFRLEYVRHLKEEQANNLYLAKEIRSELNGSN